MRGHLLLIAAALTLIGCEDKPDRPDREPPPRPTARASASAPASAAPPITASAVAPSGNPLAGTWEGAYEAKKGAVSLPPKVKDKALAADDGKAVSGAGSIEITIGEAGDLKGKIKGALGAATLTGKAEEGMIRASIHPDDPRDEKAMSGVLVGMLKGEVIHGEIHVAGRDATVVREATIDLKKR